MLYTAVKVCKKDFDDYCRNILFVINKTKCTLYIYYGSYEGGIKVPLQNIGEFFLSIIENINLGIIVVNEKGHVVYVNPAYEPFIGKSVSELMGKHISEVVDEPGIQNTVITGQAELGVWMKTKGEKFIAIAFRLNIIIKNMPWRSLLLKA